MKIQTFIKRQQLKVVWQAKNLCIQSSRMSICSEYFCGLLASHMNLLGLSQGIICRKSNPRPAQFPSSLCGGFSGLKPRKSAARPPNQLIESSDPFVREVKSGEVPKSIPRINNYDKILIQN